ncbi:MAG TPA: flagellin [Microvirga sp.]|jgi:flagellin-like hook-associated protein FlgL|nr:flagellin [Microvirga sp.]
MADIALSQGVRQNLLSMQSTVDLMGRTQNRLATGKKVNSALDNPTSFFVSAGLQNRANDLSRLLDSMGLGIKTLEAADNGIKSIKKMIESAQGTARQALQAASSTPKLSSVLTDITGPTTLSTLGFNAADQVAITVGATTITYTVPAGPPAPTVDDLADFINDPSTLNVTGQAPKVSAKIENGRIKIESLTGDELTITATGSANNDDTARVAAIALFGTPTTSTTAGAAIIGSAQFKIPESDNTTRRSLARQFEDLKSQIDQIIKDTGYNGVNLLNGDKLSVLFNETNTTKLEIEGVIFNALGLGLAPVTNGTSVDSPYGWQSDREIQAALSKLDAAMNTLRTQASAFGSNLIVLQTRQDFTKNSILTLNSGSDLLVLADTNEEGANLLALQTRQQLSTQALAMASQVDQAVLRLFG